ncbi:acylphosphatase [bacterium]|nr:acylphosphatase [bacterium]MCI0606366.1 acylphosphatase [bacterium]
MVARRYFISGDVQGVGFRYFVLRQAQRLPQIKGFVRNLYDGRVEVYAEGEEQQLKELESVLRNGPRGSTVDRIEMHEETPAGQYKDFRITF